MPALRRAVERQWYAPLPIMACRVEAARRFNTSAKTIAKWVRRFRTEAVAGLQDRSSRPLSLPSQTAIATCDAVEVLRRQRHTQAAIAADRSGRQGSARARTHSARRRC